MDINIEIINQLALKIANLEIQNASLLAELKAKEEGVEDESTD